MQKHKPGCPDTSDVAPPRQGGENLKKTDGNKDAFMTRPDAQKCAQGRPRGAQKRKKGAQKLTFGSPGPPKLVQIRGSGPYARTAVFAMF